MTITATTAKKKTPRKKKTKDALISILLDRSGSMSSVRDGTIEGFNSFISENRDSAGEARVTLVQFDNHYEENFVAESIDNVPDLDTKSFEPRGGTALLDAIGKAVTSTEAWIKENKWKGRVLFMIVTDGYENSSREWTRSTVVDLITEKEAESDWSFVYMGANLDAIAEGSGMGFTKGASINWESTDTGTREAWNTNSLSLRSYMGSGSSGSLASANFYAHPDAASATSDPFPLLNQDKKDKKEKS